MQSISSHHHSGRLQASSASHPNEGIAGSAIDAFGRPVTSHSSTSLLPRDAEVMFQPRHAGAAQSTPTASQQESVRYLRNQLEEVGSCRDPVLVELARLSEEVKQLSATVGQLRHQKKEDDQKYHELLAVNNALQQEVEALREQQATPVPAPEVPSEGVDVDTYGSNASVNGIISQMTTWEMNKMELLILNLVKATQGLKPEWHNLLLKEGVATECSIAVVETDNPYSETNQMFSLLKKSFSGHENLPFRRLFESRHMAEILRKKIYERMEFDIRSITTGYDKIMKRPCK
ncbi:MAG: hypothetical protein OXC07_07430 [Kistimonas sp.]|nr:hypothetical protein [Kistimonas sp.]